MECGGGEESINSGQGLAFAFRFQSEQSPAIRYCGALRA